MSPAPIRCPGLLRGGAHLSCGSTDLIRVKGPVARGQNGRRAGRDRKRCLLACQTCSRFWWYGGQGAELVPTAEERAAKARPQPVPAPAVPVPSARPGERD